MDDNHMDIWHAETYVSHEEEAWERWADRVEALLGHDLDGSLVEDGYALDYAFDMHRLGLTPEQAKARIEENKENLRKKRGY